MTQQTMTATDVVRRRIRALRERRGGMSAQDLANKCAELGMPGLNRQTIANLENGRRAICTVDELLVLAAALDVPPVLLLTPPDPAGDDRTVLELTPDLTMWAWAAALWITGESEHSMPRQDGLVSNERRRAWRESTMPLRQYRAWMATYDRLVRQNDQEKREAGLLALAEVINAMLAAGLNPPPTREDWVEVMRSNGWLDNPDEVPVDSKGE